MSDYGFNYLDIGLKSNDYGWKPIETKRDTHLLKNWEVCKNWKCSSLSSAWRNTGHIEWEYLMAGWFLDSVKTAEDEGLEYADITRLMEVDLLASRDRVFTKEQIQKHVSTILERVEKVDDKVYWRVKDKFDYE